MKTLQVSKFGLIGFFTFLILALIGRFLFPFGDEPDWIVRAPRVVSLEHPFWSPYFLFDSVLSSFNINSSLCTVDAGAKSIWGFIPESCNEEVEQVIYRWLLIVFISSPVFFLLVFRKYYFNLMDIVGASQRQCDLDRRLDAVVLSMVFSGFIYYLGVLAEEQLYLFVALYVFLFWGVRFLIFSIVVLLAFIDFGNTVVVVAFIFFAYFFYFVINKYSKYSLYFLSVLIALFALAVGYIFLELITKLSFFSDTLLQDKASAMHNAFETGHHIDKYPVLLRPVITFMSTVFMPPSGLKVPLLYVFCFVAFINVFYSTYKLGSAVEHVFLVSSVTTVLFFVYLFPTYGNAKYYMFVFPFFIYVALGFFDKYKIFLFFVSSSFFVFLSLFAFRL